MTRAESTETSRRKEAQMFKDYRGSLYGNYRQVKFTDVYEDGQINITHDRYTGEEE